MEMGPAGQIIFDSTLRDFKSDKTSAKRMSWIELSCFSGGLYGLHLADGRKSLKPDADRDGDDNTSPDSSHSHRSFARATAVVCRYVSLQGEISRAYARAWLPTHRPEQITGPR